MLKRLLLTLTLLTGMPALYALEGKLFFTLAPNVPDEFVHIMPYRPPHIPTTTRCVRNQPVIFLLVLAKPAVGKDGKVLVEIESIRCIEPDGKTKELVEPGRPKIALQGVKKTKRDFSGVMLSDLGLTMIAEEGDPLGKTRMTVRLRDRGDDSVKELAAEIELVEKLPGAPEKPMTAAEMGAFMTGYYKSPDPAKIPAAFAAFLEFDNENRGVKRSYDPLMWLCGFAELYKLNPQLRPELAKSAEKYPSIHKGYVALVLATAGAKDAELKDADPKLREMFAKAKSVEKSPLAFDKVTNPAQLDALWMKFFVTGKFEPIRRLVYELRRRDDAMTVAEIKKLGRKPTKEEMPKVMNGVIAAAAEWSLVSNTRQHKLVGYYLESMLLRKSCPDKEADAKVGGMLINAGFLTVVDKPGGGKALKPVFNPVSKKRGSKYDPLGN